MGKVFWEYSEHSERRMDDFFFEPSLWLGGIGLGLLLLLLLGFFGGKLFFVVFEVFA